MRRCLDEAMLQSYFDGELSLDLMESATSHLASCVTCAAAARQLEEETALLTSALAADFEFNVPSERLRERIDAAVLGERISVAQTTEKKGFFAGLLNFGTQRTLGYASLAVVLGFGAILGVLKMRSTTAPPVVSTIQQRDNKEVATASPVRENQEIPQIKIASPPVARHSGGTFQPVKLVKTPTTTTDTATTKSAPVKLLPGERTYLQTIARLDSTIKSNKNAMRPSLQVEYERNLAVVDRAIAATRSAAKSNPSDPDAADFMFAAYQSKVDLLNTIADARLGGGRGH